MLEESHEDASDNADGNRVASDRRHQLVLRKKAHDGGQEHDWSHCQHVAAGDQTEPHERHQLTHDAMGCGPDKVDGRHCYLALAEVGAGPSSLWAIAATFVSRARRAGLGLIDAGPCASR